MAPPALENASAGQLNRALNSIIQELQRKYLIEANGSPSEHESSLDIFRLITELQSLQNMNMTMLFSNLEGEIDHATISQVARSGVLTILGDAEARILKYLPNAEIPKQVTK